MDLAALRFEWDARLGSDLSLDASGCSQLQNWQVEQGATFDGRPLCNVLRPAFITPTDLYEVRRICRHTITAIRKVRRWMLSGRSWPETLDLPQAALDLVRIDPGFDRLGVTSRLDAFATPDAFSFVELNAEAPAGIAYHDVLVRMFEEMAAMKWLRERVDVRPLRVSAWLLQALLTTYNEWGRGAGKPRIAIVDWQESPTVAEFRLLAERFGRSGYPTVVADPRELEFRRGRLYVGSQRIDLVYRRVLMEDCLAHPDEVRGLVDAVRERAVCMVNPFRAHLLHRKRLFAHLTDPETPISFSADEAATVAAHVPWTRLVEDRKTTDPEQQPVDLLPFIRAHREELVLKPDDDYGGHGVCLGWNVDEQGWDEAIGRSMQVPHVVQKRVPQCSEEFPLMDGSGRSAAFLVDRDPYVFRGVLGGFLTRLAAGEIVNVTAGGGMVPTFVVSSRR